MIVESIIEELITIILKQKKEIRELKNKIKLINDYIYSYEKLSKGNDIDGNKN